MANVRATRSARDNSRRQVDNVPVRASVRFWFKPAAGAAWDATTAHNGIPCDGIQLDTEGQALTGIPGSQPVGTTPVAGPPCSANVLYPHSWYTISAGYTGQVWLGWFEDPTVTTV